MAKIQVFLDTDVIISSLLSKKGASYELVNRGEVEKVISKISEKEIREVGKRLNIENKDIIRAIKQFKVIFLHLSKENILKRYKDYVSDEEDSHVVAGSYKSNSKFLLTHNIKHYKVDKIKNSLGIMVITPGTFLQFLRSKNKD